LDFGRSNAPHQHENHHRTASDPRGPRRLAGFAPEMVAEADVGLRGHRDYFAGFNFLHEQFQPPGVGETKRIAGLEPRAGEPGIPYQPPQMLDLLGFIQTRF